MTKDYLKKFFNLTLLQSALLKVYLNLHLSQSFAYSFLNNFFKYTKYTTSAYYIQSITLLFHNRSYNQAKIHFSYLLLLVGVLLYIMSLFIYFLAKGHR